MPTVLSSYCSSIANIIIIYQTHTVMHTLIVLELVKTLVTKQK